VLGLIDLGPVCNTERNARHLHRNAHLDFECFSIRPDKPVIVNLSSSDIRLDDETCDPKNPFFKRGLSSQQCDDRPLVCGG